MSSILDTINETLAGAKVRSASFEDNTLTVGLLKAAGENEVPEPATLTITNVDEADITLS